VGSQGHAEAGDRQADGGTASGAQGPGRDLQVCDLGTEPVPQDQATPAALAKHLKAEVEKWAPIIKKAGVYAD